MSLLKKIIMLLIFFLILNVFTIYGFDYKNFLSTESIPLLEQNKTLKAMTEKQEPTPFNLVLVKKDGLVEMHGLFSSEEDVQKISDILNINRQGEYKYEANRVVDEELLKELAELVVPFKDFFADNSKLTVLNNEVTLSGELKDPNYKDLLDSIIVKTKIDLKTDITVSDLNEIKEIINKTDDKLSENTPVVNENNEETNIKEVQLSINNVLAANKINFERRSTSVTKESKSSIEEIANILKENPKLKVEIAGHTDSRGTLALNKKISLDRASSVRQILISMGIEKDRITAIGYGPEFPLVEDDADGLSEINRRVEFNILGDK